MYFSKLLELPLELPLNCLPDELSPRPYKII